MSNYLDWLECVDLGIALLDLPEGSSEDELRSTLLHDYEMSLELFQSIVELLIQFTPVLESPITSEKFHAFIGKDGTALAKVAVEEDEK
jgi:hypothetical protein